MRLHSPAAPHTVERDTTRDGAACASLSLTHMLVIEEEEDCGQVEHIAEQIEPGLGK